MWRAGLGSVCRVAGVADLVVRCAAGLRPRKRAPRFLFSGSLPRFRWVVRMGTSEPCVPWPQERQTHPGVSMPLMFRRIATRAFLLPAALAVTIAPLARAQNAAD